jgi:tetratricopeptide (TPR) repeat protein
MRIKLLTIISFPILLIYSNALAQWLPDSFADYYTRRGVDFIYGMQFDSARSEFQKLIKINPSHPSGYFFIAMVEWWKILINPDDKSSDERFYSLLANVISICDKRLEANPNDVTGLFFKGGAIGFRGRLRVHREQWLHAANDGRLAIPIVHQAYKLEPDNIDVLLGMGIYNYYRDVIPNKYPIVKPFVILFPPGDKMLGIQQLKQAADQAKYANIEATYFLIQLLLNYEKQYSQALPLALKIFKKYPNNPIFHRYVGRLHVALGRWEDVQKVFSEIINRNSNNQIGYNHSALREAYYYLGLNYFNISMLDEALKNFYKCDELSRSLDTGDQSGFMVLTNLKIGMIYDLQSKRDLAIKQYNKVLNMTAYQNSREQARQFIKKSYGQL